MIIDGEPMTHDEICTQMIRAHIHYGTLVYGHNADSANVFEHIIRTMRVIAVMCTDAELSTLTDLSQKAIEHNAVEPDLSPNQRRALLNPLIKMLDKAHLYYATLPDRTIQDIEAYSAALQVVMFTTLYFDRDVRFVKAVNMIIKGESIRKLAKDFGMKENALRNEVLNAAWCLFKIASTLRKGKLFFWKNSITQLRDEEFSVFADVGKFHGIIKTASEVFLLPFEDKTGIMLADSRNLVSKIRMLV